MKTKGGTERERAPGTSLKVSLDGLSHPYYFKILNMYIEFNSILYFIIFYIA